ncbi:hypothetical protein Q4601_19535 [Shewanella sp. 1_MG-2023]|uniref:hypothetical protein n=1 Tax=unclassified Shewanella TaxID=196818 RepID=UPI0026E361E2|nr:MULTISPECIES: hypothetical protein [unclassified Shewanella]MDO6612149.1 hypothetical protein [Shewanella sp. 7_MG-2023]MDO6772003.1 hypothetical protein [Shewanella sp. 2_MG-2023]MDO6796487.1 hypothetical protein [Shewanella sp. 1_MG-2023]
MWWRLVFITLAYILLAAHFMRYGQINLAVLCTMLPLLALLKNNLINRILQLGLLAGTFGVWGVVTFQYIDLRISMQQDWYLLAVIMGSVIGFSLFSSYCINGLVKPPKHKNCLFR